MFTICSDQFEKPGRREDFDYPQMAKEAVTKALSDAKIRVEDVNQACVGYVYGKILFTCCCLIYDQFSLHSFYFLNSVFLIYLNVFYF